ncbi:MAG: methyltransferase, partial [Pseudomonadota bacterium]
MPPAARLRARWIAFRNARLSDPGFQSWAARSPFIRPIARRRARALFDLVGGFAYSQTLYALLQIDAVRRLADGPATPAALAEQAGVPSDYVARLLGAAAGLGLTERVDALYALGPQGAALAAQPGLEALIRHHALLYGDLADPAALADPERAPALARYWRYVGLAKADDLDADAVAAFSALMAETQRMVSAQILNAYPLRAHRRLLDLGGGEGAFALAAAAAAPALEVGVFDLPAVAARAEARVADAALGPRAAAHGGDLRCDAPPAGADLVSLVRVLFDHDDATAQSLVDKAAAAAAPGGRVLVAEPMRTGRASDAYYDLYLH